LKTITHNSLQKGKGTFQKAPNGFALYFTQVDSIKVPYLVYVPKEYDPEKPSKAVIHLHGGVVSIDSFLYKDDGMVDDWIAPAADKYNTLFMIPFGKKDFGWVKQLKAFTNVMDIIEQVKEIYNVNVAKVFIGGMSNGGTAAFWFLSNRPDVFAGFYAFSAIPRLQVGPIIFSNISCGKPLYTFHTKDDSVYPYDEVKRIYEDHKPEAPDWHFETIESGDHGFIFDEPGKAVVNSFFERLLKN